MNLDKLVTASNLFFKKAQDASINKDNSLPNLIRKTVGNGIYQIASDFLAKRAVSSIQIILNYSKPNALFNVNSTGSDAAAVNTDLAAVLNKKYAPQISRIIMQKDPESLNLNMDMGTFE